jgi:hypothetical protein
MILKQDYVFNASLAIIFKFQASRQGTCTFQTLTLTLTAASYVGLLIVDNAILRNRK